MKYSLMNSLRGMILLFALVPLTSLKSVANRPLSDGQAPPKFDLSISIPGSMQSMIVRKDFENESIFSFNSGQKDPVFLFSVARVTDEQWMSIKDDLKSFKVLENKDGYITYVQETDVKKIKGSQDAEFQQVLAQMDNIISSIRLG